MPRRLPTLGAFVTLGLFWGAWAAVLPSVQQGTGTSKATLGVAMLFVALGALPAMLLVAGPAVDRFGVRAVALGGAVFAAATTLPGLASSLLTLALALTVTGAASGALDVGINANVARIESATGRRLMPLAHALYSAGVLAGAIAAGFARSAGAGREAILLAVAATIGVTAVLLARDPAKLETPRARRWPSFERALLAIGVLGAAAFVVEGGTESWSALFLERQLHAQPDVSGLGPGFFGGAMAAGRFLGQALRWSDRELLAGGSLVACAGCLLAAAAPNAPVALAGFTLAGAGVAVNAPVVFGAAGRGRRDAASAVATVTTLGYLGLLVGPPLVGGVGQLLTLRGSFVLLAGIAAAVAAAAIRVRFR